MRCLVCFDVIIPDINWFYIFSRRKEEFICAKCEQQLEKITGARCAVCSRSLAFLSSEFVQDDKCVDCLQWEQKEKGEITLDKNYSYYVYNDFLKEVVARFKFRGDYSLAHALVPLAFFNMQYTSEYDYIVPIPLSSERLQERGFNQAEALISTAELIPTPLLNRIHTEKQSKKSRRERVTAKNVFELNSPIDLNNKKVLLVDDIYTTGATLRHAAKVLKKSGAGKIESFTIARG